MPFPSCERAIAGRLVVLGVVLLGGTAGIARLTKAEAPPVHLPLATLPIELAGWRGSEMRFAPGVTEILGVDEYLNRVYARADNRPVSLYVGYYASQRQGDTIHSPMNCLPGAGWQPTSSARAVVTVAGPGGAARAIAVNQYVIQKGADRQLVLYWYQSHGRVVANEYVSRALMVYDAIRLNRTDAALVRVITPVIGAESADVERAARHAAAFVTAVFPSLSALLPA